MDVLTESGARIDMSPKVYIIPEQPSAACIHRVARTAQMMLQVPHRVDRDVAVCASQTPHHGGGISVAGTNNS